MNNLLANFPPVIIELMTNGFPIEFKFEKDNVFFKVNDFYKTDFIKLTIDTDNQVRILDKEGDKGILDSIEKIVDLNFYWWCASKTVKSGMPTLNNFWTEQFKKRKLLKKTYIYTPNIAEFERRSLLNLDGRVEDVNDITLNKSDDNQLQEQEEDFNF